LVWVTAAKHIPDKPWAIAGVACAVAVYLSFIGWLVIEPQRRERREAARSQQTASSAGIKAPLLNGQSNGD
jgi:threonine/homoserine/homoserine lactone efflux protein